MNPIQLTKQQQAEFAAKFNKEMKRMIMSWDNVLRRWHPIAIKALDYADIIRLGIPQNEFINLFCKELHGLQMSVVSGLCNNIEATPAFRMGYSGEEWANVLLMNQEVATRWQQLSLPVQQKLYREFEIMNNKAIGLKIIKAEA